MPVEVSYPGVYIEELPSSQKSVVPVATNIAAFVGRALYGPVDEPITIFDYGDFQKQFGGLQFDYPMSYAVQDFFENGGSQAIIARLFEPTIGDGYARMTFPPAPPPVPDNWVVDANETKGATSIAVSAQDDTSEAEPIAGMTFKLDGDPTEYLVTGFTGKTDKDPASMAIVPALSQDFLQCTGITFTQGSTPSGWQGAGTGSDTVKLSGGSGIPELGDTITFASDTADTPTHYTIIETPSVTGTEPTNLELTLKLHSKATSGYGAVTIWPAKALPMPVDWEVESVDAGKTSDTATVTLINGHNDPLAGDQFVIGTKTGNYVVTSFTAKTDKAPATMDVKRTDGDIKLSDFCLCCKPIFSRVPPEGSTITAMPKENETKLTVTQPTTGTIDIGDTFKVDGDDTVYSVRFIDGLDIYFLPGAKEDFTSADITFYPTLTLKAANPGKWGNSLQAKVDTQGITEHTAEQFTDEFDITESDLFNLTITLYNSQGIPSASERYLNLSVSTEGKRKNYPNRVDKVLKAESSLALVDRLSATPPSDGQLAIGANGNDGTNLSPTTYIGNDAAKTGMYLLEKADLFNLLCIPPDRRFLEEIPEAMWDLDPAVRHEAAMFATNRRAFYIVDPTTDWSNKAKKGELSDLDPSQLGITGKNKAGQQIARNCAVYFPRIWKEDLKMKSREALFASCGAIAGVMASTDVSRGVWKAPAGQNAGIGGITKLELPLNDMENGQLNPKGINCLRTFPTIGPVVWGARTLRGADAFEDPYKYVSVRRFTLYGARGRFAGRTRSRTRTNMSRFAVSLCLLRNPFTAARSGRCSNPITRRCGPRSGWR